MFLSLLSTGPGVRAHATASTVLTGYLVDLVEGIYSVAGGSS